MTENLQGRRRGRTTVWLVLSAIVIVLALLIVPPFISVRRYQSRITQVVSNSVGRPVRLSSVELRILPRPSFVITDLTVEEDPAYGAEPVLHANTVTASIRMLPLWSRGRLEIGRIRVDEASLNLVRTSGGHWNLDSFFRTAAARAQSGPGGAPMPLPYLEATDSRVNLKDGAEKLPYSLVNADLSFWQESPGDWRVRMKGQPARTDVSLQLADMGIVQLEGSLGRSPELRHSPIHLDGVWRGAQLGQLSRLLLGSDEGWRGDLTGEIHVDGTAEAAHVTTRLRASGVHREEFAPASPIDFDANCSFVYHYSERGLEKLLCEAPVGDGRARLTGDLPGHGSQSRFTVELDRVPAQIALDGLRTVRNGLDPSLQAAGAISGRISYEPADASAAAPPAPAPRPGTRVAKAHAPPAGHLSGAINVAGLRISGDSLSKPIVLTKLAVEPAPEQPAALAATVALPAGAPAPLNVTARFTVDSYQVSVRGSAGLARLRELARVAGDAHLSALEGVEGPPAVVDLTATGPWLASPATQLEDLTAGPPGFAPAPVLVKGAQDRISGSVTLHAATWKPEFLANPVEISNAVFRFDGPAARWDPVAFSYGPVRGVASLSIPEGCATGESCPPHFTVDFGTLDVAALQAAFLGARKSGTLLSSLLARLRPGSPPQWPKLEGTVRANTIVLGPVTLTGAETLIGIQADGVEIQSLDASLLGGHIHGQGKLTPGEKPDYRLKGRFDQVNAASLGRLLGMSWSGNPIDGSGDVELAGFTDRDLAASAKGSVHFEWQHGSIAPNPVSNADDLETPPALVRFDRWTADAGIANGAITLKQNQVQRGLRKQAVDGSATFGDPPRVTFSEPQDTRAATGQAKH